MAKNEDWNRNYYVNSSKSGDNEDLKHKKVEQAFRRGLSNLFEQLVWCTLPAVVFANEYEPSNYKSI